MTTDPTNHRELAEHFLAEAKKDTEAADAIADALISISHWLGAIDADEHASDREEQHQSEKFEAAYLSPADYEVATRELDEDNPDTLVGDAGFEDADTIARPLSSGGDDQPHSRDPHPAPSVDC